MSDIWAFIDEYGNPNLDTDLEGVSKFFIVSAVVLEGSELDATRGLIEPIRRGRFQAGPMKSQKLGKDRADWAQVLSRLAQIPFRCYALVVDKTALGKSGGFQFKQSFYKNLCGRLYGRLMRSYDGLHVRADNYGRDDFRASFGRYIEANHRPNLFTRGTFDFVSAKDDVLLQLADIICGLLARCYDPDMRLAHAEELLALVRPHVLGLDAWPPRLRRAAGVEGEEASTRDDRTGRYAIERAEAFVVDHEGQIDPDVRSRVAVLERLLCERHFGDGEGGVRASELLQVLRDRGLDPKDRRWFSTAVMAPLRDAEVLVTSSPHGFKLPTRASDLVSFARQAEALCVPMLNRLEAACKAVKLVTMGEVDVLEAPDLTVVRRLLEAVEGHVLPLAVTPEDV